MERDHLLVLPDRAAAEELADDLMSEGFVEVQVLRDALAGEDDADDHEWAVHVITDDDDSLEAFRTMAVLRGGWYDPDPRG